MDFSIIICTYNRSNRLKNVLQQLEEQIHEDNHDGEILVVDNNSIDNTKEVVNPFV